MPPDLMGAAEVGAYLGVSRQRVDQLIYTEGFPAPTVVLASGRVRWTKDIEAWAK